MPLKSILLSPKSWIVAFGLACTRILCYLPLPFLLTVGKYFGRFVYCFATKRRKITQRNIEVCFPHLTAIEQENLAKAHFECAGMGIFETACAWFKPRAEVLKYMDIEGLEYLNLAKAKQQGILLTTIHFCALEFGARGIAELTDFHAMYRPHKNTLFEAWQFKLRQQQSQHPPIPREKTRQALKILKNGELLWYAPDQNYGGTDHVFVPFFGEPALMITATSKLAKIANALVLPYYVIRRNNRYIIKILPHLENFPSAYLEEDCLRLNTMFETWIKEAPEQYLWAHRRFKTRPQGYKNIYD